MSMGGCTERREEALKRSRERYSRMGVKSLWPLLDPVGRPVLLETMEGKAMAIDSSIWIYQFQATMRDKEGRGLVNAHVLGFLRRICKLLFYGIKPVFVFDGGAPALKRATIAERKKKKSGAALSHAKVAERLLAAQMRREALNQVQTKSKGKGKAPEGPVIPYENAVYLEDVDDSQPRTTPKAQNTGAGPSSASPKKSRWHDHDPYKLPDVNLDEAIAAATRPGAPDPRLATEDELRSFIDEMRPEDFDVSSPAFRELPTEVQYEIVGDLRFKSRQTSYKRLQNMLRNTRTPLDFSKEQIKNLKHRNALTQQLLVTTDSIGKAHVSIPIRIASERNKEYVLVKNEGAEGGWVLGVRDDGTRNNPIKIDHTSDKENDEDDSDVDMEEVQIGTTEQAVDPDLREYRRTQALAALADRYSPKKVAPRTTKVQRKPKNTRPLFAPDGDEALPVAREEEDPELALAIQESLEYEEESNLRQALEASRAQVSNNGSLYSTDAHASSSRVTLDGLRSIAHEDPLTVFETQTHTPARKYVAEISDDDDDDDLYASPARLETALSIANAGSSRRATAQPRGVLGDITSQMSEFGMPTLLMESNTTLPAQLSESEEDMEEVAVPSAPQSSEEDHANRNPDKAQLVRNVAESMAPKETSPAAENIAAPVTAEIASSDEDEDMEEVLPVPPAALMPSTSADTGAYPSSSISASSDIEQEIPPAQVPLVSISPPTVSASPLKDAAVDTPALSPSPPTSSPLPSHTQSASRRPPKDSLSSDSEADERDQDADAGSPEPHDGAPVESAADGWDAAEEMDAQAEEGEFARFISQVKGKDLETVRREIDDEIRELHQQRKVAMRDSEDITQQMISQIMIMLRLFGIPYITAPMEAEAQCAELLSLGLVDGIITDDSDVFLFGGQRVLKNMFNQSKTVECFLLSDLERELGLDRDKLIRLANLLGSDYTEGLPGVGPVVAMELLNEFPGQDGLHKFKDWWKKVQSGRDSGEDTNTSFLKRFKKRFKNLYLPDDWPNPAVRDAYYHPTVDESEESFKWGLPDLDALRRSVYLSACCSAPVTHGTINSYFNAELGWYQSKVDDLLLPIIHKMGKRGQSSAMNKQGNLTSFFDVPVGGGHARKRQAYASKRLQQVVSDFRKQQARQSSESESSPAEQAANISENEVAEKLAKRRKTTAGKTKGSAANTRKTSATRGRRGSRGGKTKRPTRRRKTTPEESEGGDDNDDDAETGSPHLPLAVNLRLRPSPRPAYQGPAEPADAPVVDI
ncbi:PIN domain-like protein [Wolfiporia cocos MD-104 SS10]|uniref:PIN domain-like protein n=1 Tax=Wolfiporia cocos (strain MD-104) TaxID=742152 RepID=A0A2H3JJ09_WOLCO|nr:PIN domain-like protein [Wolfiporia cocos MD-104 SS10]